MPDKFTERRVRAYIDYEWPATREARYRFVSDANKDSTSGGMQSGNALPSSATHSLVFGKSRTFVYRFNSVCAHLGLTIREHDARQEVSR